MLFFCVVQYQFFYKPVLLCGPKVGDHCSSTYLLCEHHAPQSVVLHQWNWFLAADDAMHWSKHCKHSALIIGFREHTYEVLVSVEHYMLTAICAIFPNICCIKSFFYICKIQNWNVHHTLYVISQCCNQQFLSENSASVKINCNNACDI